VFYICHKLQNGINLAVGRRNATMKVGPAESGHILSAVHNGVTKIFWTDAVKVTNLTTKGM
jgi:6-phosphogluconate dehydrogenase (decarboxylating)